MPSQRSRSSLYTEGAWGKSGFGLPAGWPAAVGKVSVEHKYQTIKKLANQQAGGQAGALNEGIRIVRRRRDGKLCVEKKIEGQLVDLRREIHLLHHLKHPNVVEFVDGFITDAKPRACCLYTAYCNLGTLDDLVEAYAGRSLQISEGFVWHIFESVAQALLYIHHGVSESLPISAESDPARDDEVANQMAPSWPMVKHGDVKGGNIMLSTRVQYTKTQTDRRFPFCFIKGSAEEKRYMWPQVVLADFGLATSSLDTEFYARETAGTLQFLPPEIRITFRGDVWALGAVVWSLCHLDLHGPVLPPPSWWPGPAPSWYVSPYARAGVQHAALPSVYSAHLGNTMRTCLRKSQSDRPWAFRLLYNVRKEKELAEDQCLLREWTPPDWLMREHEKRIRALIPKQPRWGMR